MKLMDYLPNTITDKGKTFERNIAESICLIEGMSIKAKAITINKRYRIIHVLSKNLRGKTDLHGNKYKPSKWLFTEVES